MYCLTCVDFDNSMYNICYVKICNDGCIGKPENPEFQHAFPRILPVAACNDLTSFFLPQMFSLQMKNCKAKTPMSITFSGIVTRSKSGHLPWRLKKCVGHCGSFGFAHPWTPIKISQIVATALDHHCHHCSSKKVGTLDGDPMMHREANTLASNTAQQTWTNTSKHHCAWDAGLVNLSWQDDIWQIQITINYCIILYLHMFSYHILWRFCPAAGSVTRNHAKVQDGTTNLHAYENIWKHKLTNAEDPPIWPSHNLKHVPANELPKGTAWITSVNLFPWQIQAASRKNAKTMWWQQNMTCQKTRKT